MKAKDVAGMIVVSLLFLGPFLAYFTYAAIVTPYDGKMNWTLQEYDCNIFSNTWCREMYEVPRFGHDYRSTR